MKHYIVCGNYGAGNIGDEAILAGILKDIEEIAPGSNVTIMSGNMQETKELHKNTHSLQLDSVMFIPAGPRSFIRFFTQGLYKKTWKALREADVCIIGGGGLFTDFNGWKAPWIWFKQALAAHIFQNKIILYANSVGPLHGKLACFLTKTVGNWADYITVRDAASVDALKKIGVKKSIEITADPALNLYEIYKGKLRSNEGGDDEVITSSMEQKKYAVVSLRHLNRTNKLYEKSVVKFIQHLITQEEYIVYLKPFGGGDVSDKEYMNKLIAQNNLDTNAVQVHENCSLEGTLDFLKNADFMLGMRLHSLIFSSIVKTPFIGLSYTDKVKNFVKTLNLEDFVLELENVTYEILLQKYKEIQKYKDQIQHHLGVETKQQQQSLKKNRDILRLL